MVTTLRKRVEFNRGGEEGREEGKELTNPSEPRRSSLHSRARQLSLLQSQPADICRLRRVVLEFLECWIEGGRWGRTPKLTRWPNGEEGRGLSRKRVRFRIAHLRLSKVRV